MKTPKIALILVLIAIIGTYSVYGVVTQSLKYDSTRTKYYFNKTYYIADGLNSSDVGINGVIVTHGDTVDTHGWGQRNSAYVDARYNHTFKTKGNKSIVFPGSSHTENHLLKDKANSTWKGIIHYKALYRITPGSTGADFLVYMSDADASKEINVGFRSNRANGLSIWCGTGSTWLCNNKVAWLADTWLEFIFNVTTNATGSTNLYMYANGTLYDIEKDFTGINSIYFFTEGFQVGALDEVFITANGTIPQNSSAPATPTATFIPRTLKNNSINNTFNGVYINVTCKTLGNSTIWFKKNSTAFGIADKVAKKYYSGGSPGSNYTSWLLNYSKVTTTGKYYFKGSCGATGANTSIYAWTLDNSTPTLTLNSNNFFNANNGTIVQTYTNTALRLNQSGADDRALYGFQINITTLNGTVYYNFTNLSLGNKTTFQYNFLLNLTSRKFRPGYTYKIREYLADSHTLTALTSDYENKKVTNGIEFKTAEGNTVRLETTDQSTFSTAKQIDRYSITVDYSDKISATARTFYLTFDTPASYLSYSKYKAHFVILKNFQDGGNWFDFEGVAERPKITQITPYRYKIEYTALPAKTTFNSIGGLNILTKHYKFYYGDYETFQTPDPALSGFTGVITLNLSTGSPVSDAQANLYINNTYKPTVKIVGTNYILFKYTFPNITVLSETTYPYKFNVSYNTTDGTKNKFNTTINNYTISAWFLDACTVANTTAFIIKTRLETDNSLRITNLSGSFLYFLSAYPTVKKSTGLIKYNNNTFRFCKSPPNANLTGDISAIISGSGIGTRTFNRFTVAYNGTYTAYVLLDTGTTEFITFRLQDTTGASISDALFNVYRNINTTDTLIYTGYTDFAGQTIVFLDQLYKYDFYINATGYPIKTFELQPSSTSYTITLRKESEEFYTNLYAGIKYRVSPLSRNLNITNGYQNLTFEVNGTGLQEIGMNFTGHNFTCVPASCAKTLNGAGRISVKIKLNHTGKIQASYYFTPTGGDKIYIYDNYYNVVFFGLTSSLGFTSQNGLLNLLYEISRDTSPNTRTFIAGVIMICAVGIGTLLGLYGYLLVIPVVIANLLLSIPLSVGGVPVYFINPTLGIIMSIFGIALFVMAQMRDS